MKPLAPTTYTSHSSITPVTHEKARNPRKRSKAKLRSMCSSISSTIASEA